MYLVLVKLYKKKSKSGKFNRKNTALTLNIAANYGGCWDIIQAAKQIAEKVKKKKCQFQILITRLFNIILQPKMHHLWIY